MEIKKLNDTLSVSPQILPSDIPAVAASGFKAVICNRPDGEGEDQPPFQDIERAARAAGLEAFYLPVTGGTSGEAEAPRFAELLESAPKPVLAFCRSGARSTALWTLSRGASA